MGRLFVIIGGLLVLVLTLALVVPPFIDWTSYRDRFEHEASRILGRAVHVNGTASARLLPFPSVTFSDVVVDGTEGQSALTMDKFSMDAELLPFLRGQILIFDMRMEQPHLFAGLDEQGRLNWDMPANADLTGAQVRLEKLTLRDGKVSLQDQASGKSQQLQNINATLSADNLAGPWRINGHMQAEGQPLNFDISTGEKKPDSPLKLRVRLLPDNLAVSIETEGEVRVDDGRPVYKGQFGFLTLTGDESKKQRTEAEKQAQLTLDKLRLTGQFEAQNSGFNITEFRMEQGEADAPYVINGKAQLDLGDNPHFMISADGQQVYLDGIKPDISVKNAKPVADQPILSSGEKLKLFQTLIERIPVPDIPGSVDLRLPAIVASGTTIRSVIIRAEPDKGAWNISQLQADLPGRTQVEAKGRLKLGEAFGFQGSFLLASRQPAGFAAWLAGDKNTGAFAQLPAAGFSGKINLNNDVQRVDDLEIVLGETILNGQFERSGGEKRAASSVLNIAGKALDAQTLQLLSNIFVRDGDLSGLVGENLTVNLKAGPVKFADLEAEQLDTAFRLNGGKLDIDRLLISGLEGATVSATGSLRPFDRSVNATLDATVLADDLEPVLRKLNQAFPHEPLLSALSGRASAYPDLFGGTKLDLIFNAVNLFADGDKAEGSEAPETVTKAETKNDTARTGRLKAGKEPSNAEKPDVAELSFSLNGQTGALILSVAGSSKGTLTGAEPMQLSLTANAKAASGEAALALLGLPVVPLGLMGEAEVNLQAQGAPVAGMKATLEISGDDGDARLNGVITLSGDELTASGHAQLKSDDLEPFLATTGYALPLGRGFGSGLPADIASDFQFGKNIVRLPNLKGQLDGQAVSAQLDGSLSDQSVAQLRGEIQLQQFDLTALFAAMTGLPASEIESADGTNWSGNKFALRTSLPMGLDLKLSAAQAALNDTQAVTDFSARMVKNDQHLQISDLAGQWANGKLSGKVELNNARSTVLTNGELRLSGANLATLYRPENTTPPLAGEGDIKLNFTGSGKSMAGLVQSLAGEGAVTLDQLRIAGLDPAVMPEILNKSDVLSDEAEMQTEPKQTEAQRLELAKLLTQGGALSITKMQAALTLAGGIIRAPAVKIQNEQAQLQADLQLDLNYLMLSGNGALEMTLSAAERNDVAPQLQFALSGTWGEPKVKFDYQPMVQFLTQRGLLREQMRVEAAQALIIEKQRLKREADYYAAKIAERKRQQIAAEAELRKRAQEAADTERRLREQELRQGQNSGLPDIKPSLDEFLQTLPAD
ncbi:AsmA family protein [Pseudochrobactrum sp. MP213Fo]|uniref:AsmA family protein n=1 Tax=Pseudochrobactrum sp. MP213Fo TaxID=3022250 RepID=UPI003BA1DC62